MPKIKAVIFDMDGLIIDSEPIWRKAEINLFGKIGISLNDDLCKSTMGMRIDEVIDHWFRIHIVNTVNKTEFKEQIIDEVIRLVQLEGNPMPGFYSLINILQKNNIRIALASSSYKRIINSVIAKLGIENKFEVLRSGEDEKRGKPFPDIYLSALKDLNLYGHECLALEDSPTGVKAAIAAGIRTIAVPAAEDFGHQDFSNVYAQLNSLNDFDEKFLIELNQ